MNDDTILGAYVMQYGTNFNNGFVQNQIGRTENQCISHLYNRAVPLESTFTYFSQADYQHLAGVTPRVLNWSAVAQRMGKTPEDCAGHWFLMANKKKLPQEAGEMTVACAVSRFSKKGWTEEEDSHLLHLIGDKGTRNWSVIAEDMKGRTAKQCRERYVILRPNPPQSRWTEEEDQTLKEQHAKYGNKWSILKKFLPGRSSIQIKNRWNELFRTKAIMAPFSRGFYDIANKIAYQELFPTVPVPRPAPRD